VLFGWNRVSKKFHFFSTLMVCLGAHFSAIWIVVANSWMQTPAGYHIVGEGLSARAEITEFWSMVFNPSAADRLIHVIFGCWLAGAFLVISISAYYLLKKRHPVFARNSMKIGLWIGLVVCVLQGFSGDSSGKIVAEYQPAKLAALEGIYETQEEAPLTLFGIVNSKEEKIDYAVQIPKLLSFLAYRDIHAEVQGLDHFPKEDRPNAGVLFYVYRIMILMWLLMIVLVIVGIILWKKDSLMSHPWVLRMMVLSVAFPQIANQTGWFSAENGRYPWIVYGLLRISEGVSQSVSANQIMSSIIMFGCLYTVLFFLFLYLLNEKIGHGPEEGEEDVVTPYHGLQQLVEESTHVSP
jgi:cytochrome d ubiquinol oxidase subunit I